MVSEYVLAVDQGTSGTKTIIFDEKGALVEKQKLSIQQHSPKPGWLEQDPEEIYKTTAKAIKTVIEKSSIDPNQIINLSITNQRETIVLWDRETGEPVYNAIVWQDQRGKKFCEELRETGYKQAIKRKTGLIIDPYYSASKIHWLFENEPEIREKANHGKLLMGTIDTWLIWKLTNGQVHATDYSNASRTMLFNIRQLDWDKDLLDLFSVPSMMCPRVKSSDAHFGQVRKTDLFEHSPPITGVMGDSHAALFGQCCFEKGKTKATYGTGSSIMVNRGQEIPASVSGLVTSIGWGFDDEVDYVLEGNIHSTGDVIQWLVEDLELVSDPGSVEKLAKSVEDNGGVYLVPAFMGLGAPYWDNDAEALITGISRSVKKNHIIRAGLESIAYQIKDLISVIVTESNQSPDELRVDGGPTANNFLMQFQADLLNIPVLRSMVEEVSAQGAAYMGGIRAGIWEGKGEVTSFKRFDRSFEPKMAPERREKFYQNWQNKVEKSLSNESYSIKDRIIGGS